MKVKARNKNSNAFNKGCMQLSQAYDLLSNYYPEINLKLVWADYSENAPIRNQIVFNERVITLMTYPVSSILSFARIHHIRYDEQKILLAQNYVKNKIDQKTSIAMSEDHSSLRQGENLFGCLYNPVAQAIAYNHPTAFFLQTDNSLRFSK